MRTKYKLTDNAILYASVGFKQECLLQVLSLRPGPHSSLQLVVYDGTVYAGALLSQSQVTPSKTQTKRNSDVYPLSLMGDEGQERF